MFTHQTFAPHDLVTVAFLILLEGVLSIDNALVLGLLAKRLPKHMQRRALTYGLIGAFVFRFIAIGTATLLMQIRWIKLLGGLYLIYVAVKHFFFESSEETEEAVKTDAEGNPVLVHADTGQPLSPAREEHELRERTQPLPVAPGGDLRNSLSYIFWSTVVVIELTDIAFAVDSIFAAVGMVSGPEKTWVVIIGGFLGVILMRYAASLFIKLLDRFPRFAVAAYLLVLVIGLKLAIDWYFNPDPKHPRLNFHHVTHPEFWIFWGLMLACFAVGFLPQRKSQSAPPAAPG